MMGKVSAMDLWIYLVSQGVAGMAAGGLFCYLAFEDQQFIVRA